MKLLFTGGTGFLGQNIVPLLRQGYEVLTLGKSDINYFSFDLSSGVPNFTNKFDVVVHAAGKAHSLPRDSKEEKEFFSSNVDGTKNLCRAFEKSELPGAIIFISSVAVYGANSGEEINETHPLKGSTSYALSKIKAEEYLENWCQVNNVKLGILRPSLIAGENPPGNLGAMIRGIKSGKYLRIGNGEARRSLLMAEDIARIIPGLAERGGVYNVCDGYHPSFAELENLISQQLNKRKPHSIPFWMARIIARAGDYIGNRFPLNSDKLEKITQTLTFSNERVKQDLNWEPMKVLCHLRIK